MWRACVCVCGAGPLQADLPGDFVPIRARRHDQHVQQEDRRLEEELIDRSSDLHEQVGSW